MAVGQTVAFSGTDFKIYGILRCQAGFFFREQSGMGKYINGSLKRGQVSPRYYRLYNRLTVDDNDFRAEVSRVYRQFINIKRRNVGQFNAGEYPDRISFRQFTAHLQESGNNDIDVGMIRMISYSNSAVSNNLCSSYEFRRNQFSV